MKPVVSNVNSFSHFLDRLIVENMKLYDFQRRIELELDKDIPDSAVVADLYKRTITANESRAYIKNEIDSMMSDIIESGNYKVLNEVRTFRTYGEPEHNAIGRDGDNTGTEFHPHQKTEPSSKDGEDFTDTMAKAQKLLEDKAASASND